MKFSKLLELPCDSDGSIDLPAILDSLPVTPRDVAQQFLSDHGRKSVFQAQYASLDLGLIHWSLEEVEACLLVQATICPGHRRWFEDVGNRLENFHAKSWACIDARRNICQQWSVNQTWLVPPIFLQGIQPPLATSDGLHLVEGHTRVGLLAGLVQRAIVPSNSRHKVWVGRRSAQTSPGKPVVDTTPR